MVVCTRLSNEVLYIAVVHGTLHDCPGMTPKCLQKEAATLGTTWPMGTLHSAPAKFNLLWSPITSTIIAISFAKCHKTWKWNSHTPGFSALKRSTAYPRVGIWTVSRRTARKRSYGEVTKLSVSVLFVVLALSLVDKRAYRVPANWGFVDMEDIVEWPMDEFLRRGICMESSRGFLACHHIGNILYQTVLGCVVSDLEANHLELLAFLGAMVDRYSLNRLSAG